MLKHEAFVRDVEVVLNADYVRANNLTLEQKRIIRFNDLVKAKLAKIDCSKFGLMLRWMDFGKTQDDIQFIIDAGFSVQSSGDDWWVTLPDQTIEDVQNEDIDLDACLDRLRIYFKVNTDKDLAEKLGMSPANLSNYKNIKGRSFPYKWIISVADRIGVSIDWVLYGRTCKHCNY